jgi:hypothetical protein
MLPNIPLKRLNGAQENLQDYAGFLAMCNALTGNGSGPAFNVQRKFKIEVKFITPENETKTGVLPLTIVKILPGKMFKSEAQGLEKESGLFSIKEGKSILKSVDIFSAYFNKLSYYCFALDNTDQPVILQVCSAYETVFYVRNEIEFRLN